MTDTSNATTDDGRIDEQPPHSADDVEQALSDLFSLGRSWARHGLTIGKLALEQSAHSLAVTADLLGKISKRMNEEAERR